ncbi:MAG: hypothetical protein ORN49_03305 [Rhodobacteraceae bacterium]|nr:hypothetical protein [Paracoccaceae bacterium]
MTKTAIIAGQGLLPALLVRALEAQGTAFLLAEMEALARMIPGIGALATAQPVATEAEVESGFDNMPV